MTPNDEQQAIINFGEYLDESLMVAARAGTGKSTTLRAMVSKLRGVTWLCAFGKSTAGEMEARIEEDSRIDQSRVRVSTVHTAGNRIWKRGSGRCQIEKFKVGMIIDQIAEKNPIFRYNKWRIVKMVELAKQSGFGVLCGLEDEASWLELIAHFGMDIDAATDSKARNWEPLIKAAIEVYNKSLAQCKEGVIDFSDMLLAPLYYGSRFPVYDNILIDEAQDISPLRLRLIMNCLATNGRVISVGDENQSIYGFSGADDKSMEVIQRMTGADTLPLTVSYRCPQESIAIAQTWVPDIKPHPDAIKGLHINVTYSEGPIQGITFWDVANARPFSGEDVVLCRNNRPLVQLAFELIRRKIPCYVEGRDVGDALVKLARKWPECKNLDQLEYRIEEWREEEVAKYLAAKQNYKAEYVDDLAATLLCLMDSVRADGSQSVLALTQHLGMIFADTKDGTKPTCLTLSSVHKAKGKEWDRVFLLGREKYMPSKFARQHWELKQEQNLMYVAVTRNLKELIEVRLGPKDLGGKRR